MKTVRDILTVKGRNVWCVDTAATVFEALGRMAEKEVGALVVMDDQTLVGIISERDYARMRRSRTLALQLRGRAALQPAWNS